MEYLLPCLGSIILGFYIGFKLAERTYEAFIDREDEAGQGVEVNIRTYKEMSNNDVERIVNTCVNESLNNPQYEKN